MQIEDVVETAQCLDEIASRITRYVRDEGIHPTAVSGLFLKRAVRTHERMPWIYEPALCLIAQGSKRVTLGDEVFVYDRATYLVASVDLPVTAEVVEATPDRPYLCMLLRFDPKEVAALLVDAELPPAAGAPSRGMYAAKTTAEMAHAMLRLLRLLDTPEDIPNLAPLAQREILYRLLKSEEGWRLRQMASVHSHARRIAKALEWLKLHYAEPLRVEDLASEASMSVSSFHEHFKSVTAMSPLQYRKRLRLQEARRLLLAESIDAATAAHRMGYESPSQFSREYSRLFGAPPSRDIERLRATLVVH
jgi:AraC-like DNA-binding protein